MTLLRSHWQKLNSLWQKVSPKKSRAQTPSFGGASYSEPVSAITSGNSPSPYTTQHKDSVPQAYMPLWELQAQRQIIEVKVSGSTRSHQTLIMAIDAERGILWLDDLFPTQNLLDIGDEITLRHHRNGEVLRFSAPVIAWGSSFGANGLAILLPLSVSYKPRRQNLRADLSVKTSVSVRIRPIGKDISYGSVQDISVGGLRLCVPGNILGQLRHDALLPLCEFSLSDELILRCNARVRAFRLVRSPHRATQISVEFIGLNPEHQLQLLQFINNVVYLQQPQQPDLELRSA